MKFYKGMSFDIQTVGEPRTVIRNTITDIEGDKVWLQWEYTSSRTGSYHHGSEIDYISEINRRIDNLLWFITNIKYNKPVVNLPEDLFIL